MYIFTECPSGFAVKQGRWGKASIFCCGIREKCLSKLVFFCLKLLINVSCFALQNSVSTLYIADTATDGNKPSFSDAGSRKTSAELVRMCISTTLCLGDAICSKESSPRHFECFHLIELSEPLGHFGNFWNLKFELLPRFLNYKIFRSESHFYVRDLALNLMRNSFIVAVAKTP